jgi:hypothetical protein
MTFHFVVKILDCVANKLLPAHPISFESGLKSVPGKTGWYMN